MQAIITLLALAAIILLFRSRQYSSRVIASVLSFFWLWMAVAYHFAFFTSINPAAWFFGAFFLAGAFWFAWIGVIRNKLQFSFHGDMRAWLGVLLIAYALIVYPLVGIFFGHRYPAMPTFGLPCPTTIFTLGVLLFAKIPFPRSVFIVPVLWSAIGSVAAFQLRVPQDYGLLVAGVIGLTIALYPQHTRPAA
jgi:hypothetical protein